MKDKLNKVIRFLICLFTGHEYHRTGWNKLRHDEENGVFEEHTCVKCESRIYIKKY